VRKRLLRSAVVIPLVLMISTMSGPAFSSPLQSVTASSYGAQVSGLLPLGPLPQATASFPPPTLDEKNGVLELPLGALAYEGVAVVRAQTTTDSSLTKTLPNDRLTVQGGALPAGYNARSFAQVDGTALLLNTDLPIEDLPDLLTELDPNVALVNVGLIQSEALVSCVEGTAVIAAGSQIVGPITVAGIQLQEPVGNLTNQVVDLAGTLAEGILTIRRNVVEPRPNGLAVTALRIEVLGTTLVLDIAHAEVSGSVCEPIAAPAPQILPRTGGDGAGLGVLLLGGGLLLFMAERRRRANALN